MHSLEVLTPEQPSRPISCAGSIVPKQGSFSSCQKSGLSCLLRHLQISFFCTYPSEDAKCLWGYSRARHGQGGRRVDSLPLRQSPSSILFSQQPLGLWKVFLPPTLKLHFPDPGSMKPRFPSGLCRHGNSWFSRFSEGLCQRALLCPSVVLFLL